MTQNKEPDEPINPTRQSRGQDDRRTPVSPQENPAPRSPERDEEAIRKGEEILARVKPY